VGAGRRTKPVLRSPAPAPLAAHGAGTDALRGAAGPSAGRRAVGLRRPDQTSTATRSSTRLKTSAPSTSARRAETAR
jgi:hypothetical protein